MTSLHQFFYKGKCIFLTIVSLFYKFFKIVLIEIFFFEFKKPERNGGGFR